MSVRAAPVAGTPRPPGGPTRFEQVLACGQAYPRTVLEPWARVYEEKAAKREAGRKKPPPVTPPPPPVQPPRRPVGRQTVAQLNDRIDALNAELNRIDPNDATRIAEIEQEITRLEDRLELRQALNSDSGPLREAPPSVRGQRATTSVASLQTRLTNISNFLVQLGPEYGLRLRDVGVAYPRTVLEPWARVYEEREAERKKKPPTEDEKRAAAARRAAEQARLLGDEPDDDLDDIELPGDGTPLGPDGLPPRDGLVTTTVAHFNMGSEV